MCWFQQMDSKGAIRAGATVRAEGNGLNVDVDDIILAHLVEDDTMQERHHQVRSAHAMRCGAVIGGRRHTGGMACGVHRLSAD